MQVAQTNLQLFNQLVRQGRSPAELACVYVAYDAATRWFSGAYRASNKPFLAHLVGTASLVAEFSNSTDQVIAGLLHSVLEAADLGDVPRGDNPRRIQALRSVVSERALHTIIAYHRSDRSEVLKRVADREPLVPDSLEMSVTLLHLCDTLEEHLDGGMCYAPNKRVYLDRVCGIDTRQRLSEAFIELGYGGRVSELAELLASEVPAPPPELISLRSKSYVILPESYVERLEHRARRLWNKLCAQAQNSVLRPFG